MKNNTVFKRHSVWSLPSLFLSFGAATGLFDTARANETNSVPLPENPVTETVEMPQEQRSYWKHPDYDAVMEVWETKDRSLRGRIMSLNAEDKKIQEVIGKILKKKTAEVTKDDINGFVGMEGDLHLQKLGENHWKGSIYWPYKEKSYGVEVELDAGKLHVRGFFLMMPIIGRSVDLKPAAAPAPKP